MSFVALAIAGSAVIGAGSTLITANQNRKTLNKALDSQQTVDIGKLVDDARTNAEDNLKKSLELEKRFLPGQGEVRDAATQNFLDQLSGQPSADRDAALKALFDFVGQGQPSADPTFGGNELTQSAADSILQQLELGGELDPETQSAVVRGALSGAGRSGIIGSEAGRGLVARDLGLTALQLQRQRQQDALGAGVAQSQLGLSQTALEQNAYANFLRSLGMQVEAGSNAVGQAGSLFNLANNQILPESGLSSGSLADITVGGINASNQNILNAAGVTAANNSATNAAIANSLQQGLGFVAGSGRFKGATGGSTGTLAGDVNAGGGLGLV